MKEPTDFLSPETYFNTEAELNYALNGVYDILGYTYGTVRLYRLGLEADEGYYARTTPVTGPQAYNFTSTDSNISGLWTNWYVGINRANLLLENVDKSKSIDQAVRDRIKGEALFLRGYYYFLLVQSFEGVPLILKPATTVDDVELPRSSVKEVYEQIIKDMTQAESLVSGIIDLGYGGRVNKSAVRGILARVCLYMAGYPLNDVAKYKEARDWAKKVMDDTEANHMLNPSYSQVFVNYAQDKYDVGESIWEVEFWGNRSDAYTETGYVGYVNGPRSSNLETGAGFGGIRTTSYLYSIFERGDLRRDWNIANFTYNSSGENGSKKFVTSTSVSSLHNRDCAKFRREYEVVLPKNKSATPQNFPILRYSDVLLMFAEAENEINDGPTQAAVDAVNAVRQRSWATGIKEIAVTSGGSGYTSAPTITISDGGGSGATATAKIKDGQVTAIALDMDAVNGTTLGEGYTSAPTITISGGGGSGATATATIFQREEANIPTMDQTGFREFIQKERARELCFETLRKYDLVRWGIFVYAMKQIEAIIAANVPNAYYLNPYRNVSEKHVTWPIPSRELTTNKALVQNLNW
ncbi:RagB/SusD family nutrient uptake outer membrane protein [Mariniphaga sediminis]|uniref:RagB/SusD family nutrient uptake outer membrane protein n=1 Tax=Mariniphaga sediminis TaxID=1628158 RepID=UPI003567FD0A